MNTTKVLNRLVKFQGEEVLTIRGVKELFYDNPYEIMKIWGSTEGKTEGHPTRTLSGERVYSIAGPRSGRPWNLMGTNQYIQGGYIILYDVDATPAGFRVFPFNKMDKIEYEGQTYTIKK
jgi:hypothetical protein